MKTLYLLDSYGLIYRSYYAFINKPLINPNGVNISAVFGFFRNILSVYKQYKPEYAVAAFDSRIPTFRHEMYKEYKATRQKTPEDLHAQIPIIEEILTALGVPVIRKDGFEADDIIATLANTCCRENMACRILSGDKDLMQLVGCTTEIMKPDKTPGGWKVLGIDGVTEEWGVSPDQMLDVLSLIGDTADNVPGITGVGDKTAVKLLSQFGSLDGIFEHVDEIKGAIGKKVADGKDNAYRAKSLIALRTDVPIDCELTHFSIASLDFAAAARLLFSYGVPAVAKEYAALAPAGSVPTTDAPASQTVSTKVGTVLNESGATSNQLESSSGFDSDPIFDQLTKNVGDYKAITNEIELTKYINKIISDGKTVAFDCETDSLNTREARLVGFSLSNEKGKGVYIPLILPDALLAGPVVEKKVALEQLWRLFGDKDCTVIMHNGKFDYEVLLSNGLSKPVCRILDTMIAAWLLQSDRSSFGLEALAEIKLGLSTIPFNEVVPKGSTFADVPLEKAVPYAAEDADLTWQLWQLFKEKLEDAKLADLYYTLETPLLPILAEMELNGIHIEEKELAEYSVELSGQIESAKKDIYEIVGHEFNIASTKQLQEVLFTERKLPAGKKTKTGYSTDTAVLEELAALDPVPAKILDYRAMTKLLSTYVDALPILADKNARIHTSFIQTGTATGRLSSRDPNLQNIPVRDEAGRRIRLAFTAEKGNVLVSADYSQIELVVLAHLSGDKNLVAAFNNGIDVHKATASLIFGVPPEQVLPEMRRTAKTINFGVMYGMSAFRLANELRISRSQAKTFIDTYFATYSGINAFIQKTVADAEKTGYVETILGRRRNIVGINSRNKVEKSAAERMAVNTPIQGTAADIVKKAMISVYNTLKSEVPEAKMLLQVHDELIIECPKSLAEKTAEIVKREMESVVSLSVPLRVSVETGERWGDFH